MHGVQRHGDLTKPVLARNNIEQEQGWKGFLHALEGIYEEPALIMTWVLTGHDDGKSLTNIMCWLHNNACIVRATTLVAQLIALWCYMTI